MPSPATTEPKVSVELADVLEAFARHHPDGDLDRLRRAHEAAKEAHAGQVRKTGDPYITHPLAVALMPVSYTHLTLPTIYSV